MGVVSDGKNRDGTELNGVPVSVGWVGCRLAIMQLLRHHVPPPFPTHLTPSVQDPLDDLFQLAMSKPTEISRDGVI
jgi:hypothetical protein